MALKVAVAKQITALVETGVIDFYSGERRGETAATVRYARKLGRDLLILAPVSLRMTEAEAHDKFP